MRKDGSGDGGWLDVRTFGGVRKSSGASLLGALVDNRHDDQRQAHVPGDDSRVQASV